MATPAIGGVISSESGSVSLTAVPTGGWMLAVLMGNDGAPASPSGWTSLAISTNDGWRLVGKIKASESSMSVSNTTLISVMWGTGAAAVSSWQASAVGAQGSTSLSRTGSTAGSRLVVVEPAVYAIYEDSGYFSRGGAVAVHTKATWGGGGFYCVWSSGTAAGGTATATRSVPLGYESFLAPWVLVEIPESSNPAILTTTLPGPATAALTGTSTNPGAADTVLPGPPAASISGGSTNPAALDAGLPGLVASIDGQSPALDAVSYVTCAIAGSTTATVTGVQVGDLIVVMASGASLPGLPAGWTSLLTANPVDFGVRVGYKVATAAGSQSVGTWTGAQYVAVGVWRGAGAPSKGAISIFDRGAPALSGLATGAWIGAFFSGAPGPSVDGLTERVADVIYDSAGPMASRAAISDDEAYIAALFEIPPGGVTGDLTATTPGPPVMDWAGTSVNPAALDTAAPGPVTITAAGTVTNPATLDAALPGPLAITAGVVQYEQIQLRRPPRTLDQLLRDGTRRRDLIRIMTGAHAGAELPVASWSLTLDHLATIRATGQAEVRHTPKLAALLDPRSRTELAMILAIEDDDGQVVEWPKALLHTVPMRRGDKLTIDLEDRAAWVRAAGMRARMVMPRGMDVARALINLLSARAPWLPVDVPLSGVTLPQDAVLGGLGADPWQIAGELARATGQQLYIDAYGVARVTPIIDTLTADPVDVWSIDAAHLTDLQASISDTDVVNVVGLEWQTTAADGAPPDSITGGVGWWIDDTSTVGTHVLGDRVATYPGDTSLITSPGQARDAAAAHGLTVQGIAVAVDIPGVRVDPRRDVGDIVRVQDSRLGLDLVTRLTGLTWTAGAPTMGVTLADRRML